MAPFPALQAEYSPTRVLRARCGCSSAVNGYYTPIRDKRIPISELYSSFVYMRCAISARVSTADQDCGMQLLELREYALRQGWKITEEYVDSSFSGRKTNRPCKFRQA